MHGSPVWASESNCEAARQEYPSVQRLRVGLSFGGHGWVTVRISIERTFLIFGRSSSSKWSRWACETYSTVAYGWHGESELCIWEGQRVSVSGGSISAPFRKKFPKGGDHWRDKHSRTQRNVDDRNAMGHISPVQKRHQEQIEEV